MLAYNPGMMSPHRPGTPKKKKKLRFESKICNRNKKKIPRKKQEK
jgi:hypothetical protein